MFSQARKFDRQISKLEAKRTHSPGLVLDNARLMLESNGADLDQIQRRRLINLFAAMVPSHPALVARQLCYYFGDFQSAGLRGFSSGNLDDVINIAGDLYKAGEHEKGVVLAGYILKQCPAEAAPAQAKLVALIRKGLETVPDRALGVAYETLRFSRTIVPEYRRALIGCFRQAIGSEPELTCRTIKSIFARSSAMGVDDVAAFDGVLRTGLETAPEAVLGLVHDVLGGLNRSSKPVRAMAFDVLMVAARDHGALSYAVLADLVDHNHFVTEEDQERIVEAERQLFPSYQDEAARRAMAQSADPDAPADIVSRIAVTALRLGDHNHPQAAVLAGTLLMTRRADLSQDLLAPLTGVVVRGAVQSPGPAFSIANDLLLAVPPLPDEQRAALTALVHELHDSADPAIRSAARAALADNLARRLGVADGTLLLKFARAVLGDTDLTVQNPPNPVPDTAETAVEKQPRRCPPAGPRRPRP